MTGWVPWLNRDTEPEQRIHQDLTDTARNRIFYTVDEVASHKEVAASYKRYRLETGRDIDYFSVSGRKPASESLNKFVTEEDLDHVLTLLEILLNKCWESVRKASDERYSPSALLSVDEHLRRILVEEGILLRIRPEREQMEEFVNQLQKYNVETSGYQSRHRPSYRTPPTKDFHIQFERLAHQSIIDSDQAVRALAKTQRWQEELEPYNEAWAKYQDEQFSYIVPEKLYNSLEAVLVKICVEEQDWNNEGDGVSSYLDSLRESGLLEPSEEMVGEWNQILSGIQIGIQRAGGDRKRHKPIGQDYCVLMLHQMGAFITFIINRYEDEFPE